MNMKLKILGSFLIIVLVSFFLVKNTDRFSNSLACTKLEEFKREEYSGIVSGKYFDQKNHRAGTVNLTNKKAIILPKEPSSFYDFIQPNDSIVKRKNNGYLIVYRDALVKQFKIDYGCDD